MRKRLADDRGAALLEFTLVLPILLLVSFGAMGAMWLVGERSDVTGVARDVARFASIRGTDETCEEPPCFGGYPTLPEIEAYVAAQGYADDEGMSISVTFGADPGIELPALPGPYEGPWRNEVITVTVTRVIENPFEAISGAVGIGDLTYTSTAKARTE